MIRSVPSSAYQTIANTESLRNPGVTRTSLTADRGQINYPSNPVWQEMVQVYQTVDQYIANCPELNAIINSITNQMIGDGYIVEIRPHAKFADNPAAQSTALMARELWADLESRILTRAFHENWIRNFYTYGSTFGLPLQDVESGKVAGFQLLPTATMAAYTGQIFIDGYVSRKTAPGDSLESDQFIHNNAIRPDEIIEYAQLDVLTGQQIMAWRPEEIIVQSNMPVAGMLYGMPFCQPAFAAIRNIIEIQAAILETRQAARPQLVATVQGPGGTSVDSRRLADIYRQMPQGRFNEGLPPAYSMLFNGNVTASMLAPPGELFQFFEDYGVSRRALVAVFGLVDDYIFNPATTNVAIIQELERRFADWARRQAENYADKVLRPLFAIACRLSGLDLTVLNFNVRIKQGVSLEVAKQRADFAVNLLQQQNTSGIEIIPAPMLRNVITDFLGLDEEQVKSAQIQKQQSFQGLSQATTDNSPIMPDVGSEINE